MSRFIGIKDIYIKIKKKDCSLCKGSGEDGVPGSCCYCNGTGKIKRFKILKKINLKVIFRPICWLQTFIRLCREFNHNGFISSNITVGHDFYGDGDSVYDDWTCQICGYVSKGRKK